MRPRKARKADLPRIVELSSSLGLDYPGMEGDDLWVCEDDGGRIAGAVALKRHPDCLELCALGVEPAARGRGMARALVEALMAEAPGPVYLATVIPGFFETCGFRAVDRDIPATFPSKRATSWCDGCDRDRCTVMLRQVP